MLPIPSDIAMHRESSWSPGSPTFYLAPLLGPFHGAIAVPSVTRCRCRRRRGHRCAGGVRRDATVATPGEW